jgi:hypothetical protein
LRASLAILCALVGCRVCPQAGWVVDVGMGIYLRISKNSPETLAQPTVS